LENSGKLQLDKDPEDVPELASRESEAALSEKVEVQRVQFAGAEKIGVPYKVHPLKAKFSSSVMVPVSSYRWATKANEFYFEENRLLQSRLLEELVNAEGPIHFDYAVKRLSGAWGLKRNGPRVVLAVREALNLLLRNRRLVVKESFLWPLNLEEVPVRTPVADVPESKRIAEHIPLEEIEKAMKFIAKYAIGIDSESLIAETAKVFGFNRSGENMRERVYEAYRKLLSEKELVCANDVVTVP